MTQDGARTDGQPRITVVIAAWNRADLIAQSIESVLRSEYDSFDVLVQDNASEDDTAQIAQEIAKTDPRVRVIVNERNLGQFGNRNRALDNVTAPLLKYHDSDDLMYPHCLGTLVHAIDAEPSAAFALSGPRYWPGAACPMLSTPPMSYAREFLGSGLFNVGPAGALFHTKTLRDLGGFPDEGPSSDYLFLLHACGKVPIVLAPGDLFWYRVHDGQILDSKAYQESRARAFAQTWQALQDGDCPLQGKAQVQARRNWVAALARLAARDMRRGRIVSARKWFSEAGIRGRDLAKYLRRPRRSAFAGSSPA